MAGIRIGGLASGMDIDTLVSDLMKAERIPLNKLTQKKQILEWQRDGYRDMNKLLSEFDKLIFDNMTLESSLVKKTATSSNSAAVTATANSSASNVKTSIDVANVATSTTWISNTIDTTTFKSPSVDTEIELKVTNGDGVTTNTVKMTIKANSSLNDVLSQLSNNKDLGITAFSESGKVALTKNDTGSGSKIQLVDTDSQDLFKSLGFVKTDGTVNIDATGNLVVDTATGSKEGVNANFTINGLAVNKSSNNVTINNVTYNLHSKGTADITVTGDTDNMVDKIVQFVNKYNEMIEKINGKLSEARYRDYQPLSDEEKESMSEKQVEMWEERAKSGLLRNDSILSSSLNKMRSNFYTPLNVTGATFTQISEIGITTSKNYRDNGKLLIDETKLREAIEKDPNAVYQLFNADGTDTADKGIAKRLRDTISSTLKDVEEKAGKSTWTNQKYAIGKNLDSVDKQIDRFEARLTQVEDRYWRQFTAMEKAIQQANQQSTYLMQQFSGGY
ncbi:flagellar hook-associated protein 2 [Metabacillus litoralis]|uniref:flagellar hook-associated protein 2 n=1 Tax=Metabacillus litoralis TaxID=152268 RepID=UPI001B9D66DE|nr:flagellar hook-associated protein 2 [Metabacillus litoralis]UHA61594.1 flagellar hook-associated protein 2 [Metabacillus litoralis]